MIVILLFEVMVLGVMCFPRERMLRERYNVVEILNNACCALLLLEVCLLLPEIMGLFIGVCVYFVAEKGWLLNQP